MKIFSLDRESYIDIGFIESELTRLPSICTYIDVINEEFKGGLDSVWFEIEELNRFIACAAEMDVKREEEARLSSMSPGELSLQLAAYGQAGHIKLSYTLTKAITYPFYRELSLSGCFEIDPGELTGIIRDFERLML